LKPLFKIKTPAGTQGFIYKAATIEKTQHPAIIRATVAKQVSDKIFIENTLPMIFSFPNSLHVMLN
jgi:hypothetical protein